MPCFFPNMCKRFQGQRLWSSRRCFAVKKSLWMRFSLSGLYGHIWPMNIHSHIWCGVHNMHVICVYIYIYLCLSMYMSSISADTYSIEDIYLYIYMCTYIHTYLFTCTHTYIHACILHTYMDRYIDR